MTGFTSGMKSSLKDDWATPIQLFNQLDKEFRFTLDVCADENNHKCERYFDIHTDGLSQDWGSEVCWMNPPYGRVIGKWMKKARDAARGGGHRGLFNPRTHGHEMVEGDGHARVRGKVHRGQGQVRRRQDGSSVPVRYRYLRNTDDPQDAYDDAGGLRMTITQYPADLIRALPSGQIFTIPGLVEHYWPNDSYTMCYTHHRNLIKKILHQCESEGIVRKTGKTTSSHAVIWEVVR